MKYQRIIQAVMDHPWAILPSKLEAILGFLELQASGGKLTQEEIQAAMNGSKKAEPKQDGDIGIIPVLGTITHRMGGLEEMSGGTSLQRFSNQLRGFVEDDSIKAIVLDVDSPGGSTAGLQEAADEIYKARGQKPIVAHANTLMASAAYFLGAQASEVVASSSGLVGSIGTILVHADESKLWDERGIKFTTITAGKDKALGSELEPLEDEGRAYLQNIVDQAYGQFTKSVARGRGVSEKEVRGESYGQGRVLTAKEAKSAGLIDRIGTMDDTLSRLAGRSKSTRVVVAPYDFSVTVEPKATEEDDSERLRAKRDQARAKFEFANRKNQDLTTNNESA